MERKKERRLEVGEGLVFLLLLLLLLLLSLFFSSMFMFSV